MSFPSLLGRPLLIEHREATGVDQYGNEVFGVVATTTTHGYTEQTAAAEVIVDRHTYTADWLVVVPTGTRLGPHDRVKDDDMEDRTLEIMGPPTKAWNPRARAVHHVEARAVEVTG